MRMERIEIVRGDITTQEVDAIVNAANESLLGGGGVDGAIHRAAGPELVAECRTLGGCPTGQARITRGYRLPAKHVIHTVGPVWRGGGHGESELLASCYRSSLELARASRCEIVAFPAISCGVYGYPLRDAASISLDVVRQHLQDNEVPRLVRWVMFDAATYDAWIEVYGSAARD
jgi:O-acetyl-ADP-ribose deacetylase (regulator of RNase III)